MAFGPRYANGSRYANSLMLKINLEPKNLRVRDFIKLKVWVKAHLSIQRKLIKP
ncbi:hypothetical protein [Moorena sp. SIO3I6]|uniref:hypothetical protein n=1 Tax=Moorena sp. SIO3I6 TaxID=2607831 RepID=UPI0013F7DA26|nr:hypothetical protein [Moorena sp. SIO3I6]NEP23497.1 hypothetical protein [Moorena sp. SIO3I6]